jgi:daunorubicin resistance ABC transporter membrane protein
MTGATPARDEVVARPSATRVVTALVGRDLRRFFRQPSRIVGSIAQPLILWAVLGAGFGDTFQATAAIPPAMAAAATTGSSAVAGAGGYLAYFYPGTVVLAMLFTAIFSTMSVIDDRHHGFLQAVLVAPVSRAALVLGKTLGGVTIALTQAAAFVALAPLAGFGLGAMNLPLVFAALGLAALGFTALGFAAAWWIDSTQGYHGLMSIALIPLWMLSGAMFPASGSRGWVRVLMRIDPMTYAVSAVRRGLGGTASIDPSSLGLRAIHGSAGLDLTVTAAFSILAVALAVLVCRRRP